MSQRDGFAVRKEAGIINRRRDFSARKHVTQGLLAGRLCENQVCFRDAIREGVHVKIEELLMYQTDLQVLPAGSTLFTEGESGDSMYVLVSGLADVMLRGKIVETATSGAILGEMAIIDNSPRAASVIARDDCSFIAINAERFNDLTREVPNFALHVMRAMADRLRRVDQML